MARFCLLLMFIVNAVDAQLLSERLSEPSKILDRPHQLLIYTPPSLIYSRSNHLDDFRWHCFRYFGAY